MLNGVTQADAIGVLERMMQFAGQRHRIIANNIANADTPGFRPVDVSVDGFRAQLREAVDRRNDAHAAGEGALSLEDSREVTFEESGLTLHPEPVGDNILFHDGNDRSPEHMMQDLVENFMVFRAAAQFMRRQFALLESAIAERVV
jgi:flagellar basal-body rod protein FlgB